MTKKTQSIPSNRTPFRRFRNVVLAISLWWIFWLLTQYLFIGGLPDWVDPLLDGDSSQQRFIYTFAWIVFVAVVCLVLWHGTVRDYSFFKAPRKLLLAYLLPLGIAVWLLLRQPLVFGIATPIFVGGMVIGTVWQDVLTFGFLYTLLDKQIGSRLAAVLTTVMFFLGHFLFVSALPVEVLLYAIGFSAFTFLRYRTHSIYLTNALHLSYLLLVV